MTFLGLMVHNVSTRVVRGALTAFAVAIGVMTVVTLGLVTTDRILTIEAGRLNPSAPRSRPATRVHRYASPE